MAVSKNSPRSPQAATPTRMESDSFGPIEVAADRYWGAQTERSRRNFRIGEERMPLPLVKALAMVKKAAALANLELGLIDGLGDLRTKMRELYGDEVRFSMVAPSTSWLRRRRGVSVHEGGSEFGFTPGGLAADLISAIEARALWTRFGF